jgi:hypothetical protein
MVDVVRTLIFVPAAKVADLGGGGGGVAAGVEPPPEAAPPPVDVISGWLPHAEAISVQAHRTTNHNVLRRMMFLPSGLWRKAV